MKRMNFRTGRRSLRQGVLVGVVAAVLGAGGATALATGAGSWIVGADGTIYGCYKAQTGQLRVVALGKQCGPSELALQWNQTGPKGATGAVGATGADGATGATGAQGPKGDKGDTGGIGPTGATGDPGRNGANGSDGATGAQGPKGDNGDTGGIGPTGATGDPGRTGATGDPGTTGAQGAKGDPGAGFTWRGEFVDDGAYNAGDAVSLGGSAWITNVAISGTGTADPPDAPWQLLAARGVDGSDGADGAQGLQGPRGFAGATGSAGLQGPAGPQGPPGTSVGGLPVSISLQYLTWTATAGAAGIGMFCPTGKIAIGGYLDGNTTPDDAFETRWEVTYSRPDPNPRSWSIGYSVKAGQTVAFTYRVVCLG